MWSWLLMEWSFGRQKSSQPVRDIGNWKHNCLIQATDIYSVDTYDSMSALILTEYETMTYNFSFRLLYVILQFRDVLTQSLQNNVHVSERTSI